MALKDKENLLVGVIMGSFLPNEKKTELIDIVRNAAAKEREPQTNADRIRAMSDEELAQALYNGLDAEYCTNDPVCADLLDSDDGIPEEKCIACALRWLRQPLKENDHA